MIGSEIIKPNFFLSQQARWIYKESIIFFYPVIMGTNLPEGLTLFNFGNLPANTECKVLLKIAFLCQLATPLSMFLKFPLKMYTPDGSKNWFHTPNLSFKLNCDNFFFSDASCNLPFTYLLFFCSIVLKENLRNDHFFFDNNNGTSAIFTINFFFLLIPMVMIAF
ncbi:hypothetical protein TRFO_20562 [Tritrichomonas foetus]|uniref:Uncharacterized protein n=1 Tax=Tritrichomonas foetus TaxID=1144522 RepID=A0A1J4KKH2_9EUKA|nr:hypothetical protein TRFO_20562 [Tritrichomonas foetus]|eukprot:OHT10190.1 hypothetical protein TRFO_20562 [Tritrichomonas foetus]